MDECKCGCGGPGVWRITGKAYLGYWYSDELACDAFARYCRESAAELGLPFELVAEENNS
jgi:hypothetical protein